MSTTLIASNIQKGDVIKISGMEGEFIVRDNGIIEEHPCKPPPDVEYANNIGKVRNNHKEKEIARQKRISKRRAKKKFNKNWSK